MAVSSKNTGRRSGWTKRLLEWLYLRTQCKAERPCRSGVVYCVRNIGHFGRHRTWNEERF
jgi:hypothetical protein